MIRKFVVGVLCTNCYLVCEERSKKAVLIDPGAYDPEITRYAQDNDIEIIYTVNTHGHVDHMLGDAAFGFPVLIHELDEPCLRDPGKNMPFTVSGDVQPVRAERLLKDGDTIDLGGEKLEVIHTPGHTPGGISIRCGDILFSGDTLFCEGVGRTDLAGGDKEALLNAIRKKLFTLPDSVRVFPGHGPETTIGHEKENNSFLG